MNNPFCKKWHLHWTQKGKDFCNETGISKPMISYLWDKTNPWEKENA